MVFRQTIVVGVATVCASWTLCSAGTVTLDGRVGPGGPILPDGNAVYTIDASVGTMRGNNLFHSFSQFDLIAGDTADFTGPPNINNIIARVTGNNPSMIDGTLQSSIPGANFFFINPFGIIFGPNAQINVSGAFTATTAAYVKLADGGRYDARNPANDILTAAPVRAFGFLDAPSAPITVDASFLFQAEGTGFSLIGGDIKLLNGAGLFVPSGRINLLSIQSAGELTFDATDLFAPVSLDNFSQLGLISIDGGGGIGGIDVSGTRGGRIDVMADTLRMVGLTTLEADNSGPDPGLGINVNLRSELFMDQSNMGAFTLGSGQAGSITIQAQTVSFHHSEVSTATIHSDDNSTGNGGDITINAQSIQFDGGTIGTSTFTPGNAGNITITAPDLEMGYLFLFADTTGGGAGRITIVADNLHLLGSTSISSRTLGPSAGGDINVTASQLLIDGTGQAGLKSISSATSADFNPNTGPGGNISIHADTVKVVHGGQISASSDTSGAAGSITIDANNRVLVTGQSAIGVSSAGSSGGDVTITAGNEILLEHSAVSAEAFGDGGNVTLTAPSLIYLLHSQILAQSDTGNGGNVTIDPQLIVLNNSLIKASAITGNGGNIGIVSDFFLASESVIDASSEFGLQGTVTIDSPNADLAGNFVGLSADPLDADSRLRPHCSVRLPSGVSSFTLAGHGGTPIEPDGLLPALPGKQ